MKANTPLATYGTFLYSLFKKFDNSKIISKKTFLLFTIILSSFSLSLTAQTTITRGNGLLVNIPDNNTTGATATVSFNDIPANATLTNIEVSLGINHGLTGDLKMELVAPTGNSIVLVNRPARVFPDETVYDSSNFNSNFEINFSDSYTNDAKLMGSTISSGDVICEDDGICDYYPNDEACSRKTFADLVNEVNAGNGAQGNWKVIVSDLVGGDIGNFMASAISLTYIVTEQTTISRGNGLLVNIPDNNASGATATVSFNDVPNGATLTNISVSLGINHAWSGDLKIELTAPTGDAITLVNRPARVFPDETVYDASDLNSNFEIDFSDAFLNDPKLMGSTLLSSGVICEDDGICDYYPNDDACDPKTFADLINEVNNGDGAQGNWQVTISDLSQNNIGNFIVSAINLSYEYDEPVAHCQPATYTLGSSGEISINPSDIDDGSTAYGSINLSLDQTNFDCSNIGTNTVILTVTDINGHTDTCQTTITILAPAVSTLTCPNDIIEYAPAGGSIVVNYDPPSVTGCLTLTQTSGFASGDAITPGNYTNTFEGETLDGTIFTCSFNVTINAVDLAAYGNPFITKWHVVENEDGISDRSIKIPTKGNGYDFVIDWGDGSSLEFHNNGNVLPTHIYDADGDYSIKIYGDFPRIDFREVSWPRQYIYRILEVEQWGDMQWNTMDNAFRNCYNLDVTATDTPDLSNVTTTRFMFHFCSNLVGNNSFNNWNVENVEDTSAMFFFARNFNQPLNNWNVGEVTNMSAMFQACEDFDQDLSDWDVSKVENMGSLFNETAMDQDLSDWDISSLTSAAYMFSSNIAFSTANYDATLIGWATLNPGETQIPTNISLNSLTKYCASFEEHDLLENVYNWNISDQGIVGPECIKETRVALDNGKLTIIDIATDSDDQITLSNDGTTLTISNLITPKISGNGVIEIDPTTVALPLASITNGIEFNAANGSNNGFNIITFTNDLTLTGLNNGISLTGLKNYEQTGSINIEGDLSINGIGFDLTLGEITANNFTIDGVDRILDQENLALTISGVTQMQAGDGINIENGQSTHTFVGEVHLTSNELIFSAGADTTFGEINTTDAGIGIAHTFTAAPGDITFNGDVTVLGGNGSTLFVCSLNNISQTGGIIDVPFLVFRGNGNTTVTIDNNNNIEALGTSNPFDANAVDLASLSFTNTSNMFLEDIDVDEFNLTAPQFDFEPGFTNITKHGSGVSNFNADIDVNNGTGTVIINHNAGTINFNGDTNDFLSKLTYNGVAGTITNINSDSTTFPDVEADNHFTFGFLNVIGDVNIGNNQINILNEARFIGEGSPFAGDVMSPHILRGSGSILGGPVILENEFVLVPGEFNEALTIVTNDLQINGGVFTPLIIGETTQDRVDVNGTVTLTNATLFPSQGFTQLNQEVILINNDGNDAVVGVFDNLPEGSLITLDGGYQGLISYVGGDGNDVTLSTTPETQVDLSGGTLTINDINGGVSNDAIVLSNDGTTLTISNLVAPVQIGAGITSVTQTSVSVPIDAITNGFQFLSEDGVNSITINEALTLSGSTNFFAALNLDSYIQNAPLTIGGAIFLEGTGTSDILFGKITANNLNLTEFNNVDDSQGKLTISDYVVIRVNGIVNIDNGSGNESNHFFGGEVDIEASLVSNFTAGSDLSIAIRTIATIDDVNNIIASPGAITFIGTSTTAGDSDINVSATSINQLADATIITDELIITPDNNAIFLSATNDINVLNTGSAINNLVFSDIDDLELGAIEVGEFTITAPSINITSQTDFAKFGSGEGSFVGYTFSNAGTGIITHDAGTIIFNGDTVLFGGITYNGFPNTTTKFTGGQTFIGDNFTFGNLLIEDRFIIESGLVTVLNETIVSNDSPTNTKVLGGYGTFTGSPTTTTTISTNGKLLPFTFGSLTFENDLRIENGGTFEAFFSGTELDDYSRVNVLGTVALDNAELNAAFNIPNSAVGPGFELVIIDNDGVDPIVGTFNGFPEGSLINGINTGTLSYTAGDGNDFAWVYDDEAPMAVCQDLTLNIGLGGITVTGDQLDGGAIDNTGINEILIDGQSSLDFTYGDDGDHQVTITFADTNGNTAECIATITINSNATLPILISEYKPASSGSTQEIEIKGEPGESFAGAFVVIDGVSSRNIGLVKSVDSFSGTFDANGLLTATIPDVQNPSHTTVLTTSFTGIVDITDVDTDDDGTVDDITSFGLILDAVGITNGAVCCPIDVIYGQEFGGVDLPYIGGQASAIFREASVGDFYQISLSTGAIYDITATAVDASIFSTTPTAAGTFGNINPARSIAIQPRVFLQGAALNPIAGEEHLMRDDLRIAGIIPTRSPYVDMISCDATVFNTTGENAIVDWVWIELRDKNDNEAILEGQSALLQRDGHVVAVDGTSALSFDLNSDNYYVTIKHRTHLGIISSTAIALDNTATAVDFTNAIIQITYGINAQTEFGMRAGMVGMWTGNVNGDTIVQYSGTTPDTPDILSKVLNDPGNFLNFPTYAVSGYQNYDINMDGNTQYSGTNPDTPIILQNVLAHPGNFLNFSTYQIIEQLPENN